ncbi:conjugal transfer protein TraG, partial [Mesorhizobium sp. M2A.F.Ca.ET.037.01.1.1]|uniref:type IV secretory system conjugative DNA transfer family protein n=1 Tax=Mesorhizobium sp. M2A.F.Ca.ET.037.01.1.1 TaxID=2496748 RepID=UPI000FD45E06
VVGGATAVVAIAATRETVRLIALADRVPVGRTALSYADPGTAVGATIALMCGVFALRVAIKGNAAFAAAGPRRIRGKRAIHGETDWMGMEAAGRLFSEAGGIVIGERYRVDRDHVAGLAFRADSRDTWGAGGRSPLLCFDGSFGSSHGIVFAGSGGFKTTSVTIPSALKWGGGLVV